MADSMPTLTQVNLKKKKIGKKILSFFRNADVCLSWEPVLCPACMLCDGRFERKAAEKHTWWPNFTATRLPDTEKHTFLPFVVHGKTTQSFRVKKTFQI